jgi:O-antigen/teichoic acid export membrane protein
MREFDWTVVRSNLGFGASGLIVIVLSNVSIILVSRLVIEHLGITSNGIFSNAWRLASVYLGAVTTTAISYYLPTLSRSESREEMNWQVNSTVRFYLFVMPPIMTVIMIAREPIVWLILSSKFSGVAPLLLVFVPAELCRVVGETMSVALLARRRVLPYTLLYFLVATAFVASAILLIPVFGIIGAAYAYAVSTFVHVLVYGCAAAIFVGVKPDKQTISSGVSSFVVVIAVSACCYALPCGIARFLVCFSLLVFWLAIALMSKGNRHLIRMKLGRLGTRGPV